jgi:hypothetical protein
MSLNIRFWFILLAEYCLKVLAEEFWSRRAIRRNLSEGRGAAIVDNFPQGGFIATGGR